MSTRREAHFESRTSTLKTAESQHPSHSCHGSHGKSQSREDIFAALSSWLDYKEVMPTEWKIEMDAIKSLSRTEVRQRPEIRNRIQDIAYRIRVLSDTLTEFATAIKFEREAVEAFNRMTGLASLPDDLLTMIFDYVVNKDENKDLIPIRWRTAVTLSHVCQHFRDISLSCPRLWTTMNRSSRMVAACLPRAKGVPLAVDITLYPNRWTGGWNFDRVLTELLPNSNRWGHLGINFDRSYLAFPVGESDVLMGQKLHNLDAPLLEELYIQSDERDGVDVSARCPWDWSHWITPKLRRIQTKFYFPRYLPGLANVTTLDLTLPVDYPSLPGILVEISRMDNLQDLVFDLRFCRDIDSNDVVLYERTEFPRIQRLQIRTKLHYPFDERTPTLIRTLFSALFFPSAVDLQLELRGFDYTGLGRGLAYTDVYNYFFDHDIIRIFRHVGQFPRVENFHLKINAPLGNHHSNEEGYTILCIPLNMLPNAKHFTMESNTRLDIEDDPDEIFFEEEHGIAPRVVGHILPVLKTMTLDMLDASVVAEWAGEYLGSLKDRGELEGFRELVVMEDSGAGDRRNVSYLGDEAFEWCRRSDRSEQVRKALHLLNASPALNYFGIASESGNLSGVLRLTTTRRDYKAYQSRKAFNKGELDDTLLDTVTM